MFATFNRFEIEMTRAQAQAAAHQGQCIARKSRKGDREFA